MRRMFVALWITAAVSMAQNYWAHEDYFTFSPLGGELLGKIDTYNEGFLPAADGTPSAGDRIRYPGNNGTDTGCVAAVGYWERSGNLFSNAYAWGERSLGSGRLGGWIGDLNASDNRWEYSREGSQNFKTDNVGGLGGIWWVPRDNSGLNGVSLLLRVGREIDDNSANQSGTYYSSVSSTHKMQRDVHGEGVLTGAYQLGLTKTLLIRLIGGYQKNQSQISESDYNSNESSMYTYSNMYGALEAGLQMRNNRMAAIGICSFQNIDSSEYRYNSSYYYGGSSSRLNTDKTTGLVVWGRYMQTKRMSYLTHRLTVGVSASVSAGTYTEVYKGAELTDFVKSVRNDNVYNANGVAGLPIRADIDVFHQKAYLFVKYVPYLKASLSSDGSDGLYKYSTVELDLVDFTCGVRGLLGDRLEFSLTPGWPWKISALEVSYRF